MFWSDDEPKFCPEKNVEKCSFYTTLCCHPSPNHLSSNAKLTYHDAHPVFQLQRAIYACRGWRAERSRNLCSVSPLLVQQLCRIKVWLMPASQLKLTHHVDCFVRVSLLSFMHVEITVSLTDRRWFIELNRPTKSTESSRVNGASQTEKKDVRWHFPTADRGLGTPAS